MRNTLILFRTILQLLLLPTIQGRIVGGTPAADGEYPSYVHAIDGSLCGGTLIHQDIVLTAAHCAPAFSVGKTVYIGAIHISGSGDERKKVTKQYPHPSFNKNGHLENDIMLLQLDSSSSSPVVKLSKNPAIPQVNSKVDVIGFGRTSESGSISTTLLKVQLPVQTFSTCSTNLEGTQYAETQLCVGKMEGGKDSCNGDSGGPLFVAGSNVQVAIVSYGAGCARPGLPSINTKVSAFIDFIEEGICELSNDPPEGCFEVGSPVKSPTTAPKQASDSCPGFICCN